jgi:molybdopterin/thiamine biosynthesis adenylyltransferase
MEFAIKVSSMKKRYEKNQNTISSDEQVTLSTKRACIVGLGGLGQYVAMQLARLGIGQLKLIDYDFFDETNLNRQLFCTTQNIGLPKVSITENNLITINPEVEIIPITVKLDASNASMLLRDTDVVIDSLDSINDRLILQDSCKDLGLVLVSAAIGGWFGHLAVVRPGDDTLKYIYADSCAVGIEKEMGNPAFTPAILASMQTVEVVKVLLGKETLPPKKVLYIDLLNLVTESYEI